MPPRPSNVPKPAVAPRLPPLPRLKVRRPNQQDANPCMGIMSSVLGCWASNGQVHEGCAILEQQLRACMDTPRPDTGKKSQINKHLARMYPMMKGPTKKK